MTRAHTCLFEHVVTRAVVLFLLPMYPFSCDRTVVRTSAHGPSEQAIGVFASMSHTTAHCLVRPRKQTRSRMLSVHPPVDTF